jgi:hypothetical protein
MIVGVELYGFREVLNGFLVSFGLECVVSFGFELVG